MSSKPRGLSLKILVFFPRLKPNMEQSGKSIFSHPSLKFPKLTGPDIESHFYNISKKQIDPYVKLINRVIGIVWPEFVVKSCEIEAKTGHSRE